jgi:hypothetical protein
MTYATVRGVAWLIVLLGSEARANHRVAGERCIEIMHVGSQDTPVGGVRMCIGARGRSREDSIYENKWTFYFDETTYRRLEGFVVRHQSQDSLPPGPRPRGEGDSSFSVTWLTKKGERKYIISPSSECTYLDELVHSVDGNVYVEFIAHGEGLMARERCPRDSGGPNR